MFQPKRRESRVCSDACTSAINAKRQAKYTEEQIQQAILLRGQGLTNAEIEQKTGIKTPSLKKIFADRGIKLTASEKVKLKHRSERLNNPRHITQDNKQYKKCGHCKQFRLLLEFGKDKGRPDGLTPSCKPCQHQQYRRNSEVFKQKSAQYRRDHTEQYLESQHRYYLANRDLYVARAAEWARKNPEKHKDIKLRYRENNRPLKRMRTANYRARKQQATPRWLTLDQKEAIKQIYLTCPKGYHVDHIVPIRGENVCGLHVPWNLQHLPASANMSKAGVLEADLSRVGLCHQYIRRLDTIEEDLQNGCETNLKASDFSLQYEIRSTEHDEFIARYEWLGKMGYAARWVFTARYNGKLGGVVVLSEPIGYSNYGMKYEALIQRGASAAWTPKNLGSRLVMFACKWMVQNTDKRLFVAYSDPEAGEIGTIYQACNFDYLGGHFGTRHTYELPNGRSVSPMYFTRSSTLRRYAEVAGIKWDNHWYKPGTRYIDRKVIPKEILKFLYQMGKQEKATCPTRAVPPKAKYALLLKRNPKEVLPPKIWVTYPYPKRQS